jgi:D-serine deaminase-like pyridoxal phosphate-dependent protein
VGITCATVWEALAMVSAGLGGILVANQVVDHGKLRLLAEASRASGILLALDSTDGTDALTAAVSRAGAEIGVLIEVDIGMGRGGVRTVEDGRALAEYAARLRGIVVRGVMGWEGHVALEADRKVRAAKAHAAIDKLVACADSLREAGIKVDIVSAGGTNTYDLTGADPRVTEIQAGSYALMDTSYASFSPAFQPALSVLGTVLSRHGRRVILDCGSKAMATMIEQPRPRGDDAVVTEVHEEHALLDVTSGSGPRVGDRVELIASYCSGTVALHDAYFVVEDSRVLDIWPITRTSVGLDALT